jgi:hypothetical protein
VATAIKEAENALGKSGASCGLITKFKQSIFFRYLWVRPKNV